MGKIIVNIERLKKEVLDVELEIKEGETLQTTIEKFKEQYKNGDYHTQFDDYGPFDCDVCFQRLSVFDDGYSKEIYSENLDSIPTKNTTKKVKP